MRRNGASIAMGGRSWVTQDCRASHWRSSSPYFPQRPAVSTRRSTNPNCCFPSSTGTTTARASSRRPNGDLLVCWFHGSGERTADDVKIEGARLRKGAETWSPRFTMADTPGYPDTNCCMFIDPRERLWLLWPTILANKWETALMKYRISSDYDGDGPPKWEVNEVMHVTPGPEFEEAVNAFAGHASSHARRAALGGGTRPACRGVRSRRCARQAADKLSRRLGWMTRAHPFVLDGRRLIVPLYSDGFSFSLMAITDDWGQTWHTSTPLIGAGNIQPSIVKRKDGSLYTLMRDNGPPPKRLHAERVARPRRDVVAGHRQRPAQPRLRRGDHLRCATATGC